MLHHVPHRPPIRDFPADEWNVIEKGFHPELLAQLETMLALGNGYFGMRGCPEEGGPNAENATLINGFYETHPIVYVEGAYGFTRGSSNCSPRKSSISMISGAAATSRSGISGKTGRNAALWKSSRQSALTFFISCR